MSITYSITTEKLVIVEKSEYNLKDFLNLE